MTNIVIRPKPGAVKLTPHLLAKTSDRLHAASQSFIDGDQFQVPNYFLFCASIEIGFKAAILFADCTERTGARLKTIGHDLLKVHAAYSSAFQALLTVSELATIAQINSRYRNKGLEYFSDDMLFLAMRGFKDMPQLSEIEAISIKVNSMLRQNNFFVG